MMFTQDRTVVHLRLVVSNRQGISRSEVRSAATRCTVSIKGACCLMREAIEINLSKCLDMKSANDTQSISAKGQKRQQDRSL